MQDKFKIRMSRKVNGVGKPYFQGLTKLPVQIDLHDTVVLFFPPEKENGDGELVVRRYDVAPNENES